jgi:hypothetical protein
MVAPRVVGIMVAHLLQLILQQTTQEQFQFQQKCVWVIQLSILQMLLLQQQVAQHLQGLIIISIIEEVQVMSVGQCTMAQHQVQLLLYPQLFIIQLDLGLLQGTPLSVALDKQTMYNCRHTNYCITSC